MKISRSRKFAALVIAIGLAFCQIAEANLAAVRNDADYGPSYAALDEGQKALYRALKSACAEDGAMSVFSGPALLGDLRTQNERWDTAIVAYQADHPEQMRLDTVWITGLPGLFTVVHPTYHDRVSEDQEAQALTAAETLCASLEGLPQREQVTELYRRLTSTVTYELADEADHTMYAALLNHRACCQGIACALGWCLDRLGVESRIIAGRIDSGRHAWNAVKLDGVWYELDATGDLGRPQEEWHWFLADRAHTLLDGAGMDCPTQKGP